MNGQEDMHYPPRLKLPHLRAQRATDVALSPWWIGRVRCRPPEGGRLSGVHRRVVHVLSVVSTRVRTTLSSRVAPSGTEGSA